MLNDLIFEVYDSGVSIVGLLLVFQSLSQSWRQWNCSNTRFRNLTRAANIINLQLSLCCLGFVSEVQISDCLIFGLFDKENHFKKSNQPPENMDKKAFYSFYQCAFWKFLSQWESQILLFGSCKFTFCGKHGCFVFARISVNLWPLQSVTLKIIQVDIFKLQLKSTRKRKLYVKAIVICDSASDRILVV